jgi:hypothetical protein
VVVLIRRNFPHVSAVANDFPEADELWTARNDRAIEKLICVSSPEEHQRYLSGGTPYFGRVNVPVFECRRLPGRPVIVQ